MKRWLLVLSLSLLSGCDVATIALLMGGHDSSSSDGDAPLPAPDTGFAACKAFTALINPALANDERTRSISVSPQTTAPRLST